MRRESPGSGVEREVVEVFHLAAVRWNIERQDELTLLSGIADQARRIHVGRGHLGAFSGGR